MAPGTMRSIDFWVGIPLCFVLTIVYRLQRLVGLNNPRYDEKPRHLLFIQLAEMGTMVVASPAFRTAQELFPGATLHVLCFTEIRSSVEMIGIIDQRNILTIESRSLKSLLLDTLRFLWSARRRQIDAVINLETFVRYSTLLSFLTGARKRVGFHRFNQEGLYTGDLLTHKVIYNPHIHAGHTFLDLVHALATPPGQVPHVKRPIAGDRLAVPKMAIDAAVTQAIWTKLRTVNSAIDASCKLVILNPSASNRFPMRSQSLDFYANLSKRLLEDSAVYVVLTGVADEDVDPRHICACVNSPRVINLTGQTTLTELLHLFDAARVVVTTDSGPAHFASLTHAHAVVLFGPETPDRYRPLAESCDVVYTGFSCSPCMSPYNQRLTPCNDNLCMKSIDLDAVYNLVRRHLQSPAPALADDNLGRSRVAEG